MSFRTINNMAADLQTLVSDADIVKEVHIAAITSYESLYDFIPTLGRVPAAVVCLGIGEFTGDLAARNLDVGILIVDDFAATREAQALSIWTILENVNNLFLPEDGKYSRAGKVINNVGYLPGAFRPVAVGSKTSAYLLELRTIGTR